MANRDEAVRALLHAPPPCDCGPQGCGANHCVMDVIEAAEAAMRDAVRSLREPQIIDLETKAWQLYCKETAGSMDVRDFWEELPPHVQQMFLDRVRLGHELNTTRVG